MAGPSEISLREHFAQVEDPRIDRTKQHQLLDILIIAICAVICGADDWVAIERFGQGGHLYGQCLGLGQSVGLRPTEG